MIDSKAVGTQIPADSTTPYSGYQLWLPGVQAAGSGNVVDQSGNSADGVLGSGLADGVCWANAGWFTSAATGNDDGSVNVPASDITWDMALGQSMIFSLWVKSIAIVAQDGGFGTLPTGASKGFRSIFKTSDKLNFAVSDGSTTVAMADGSVLFDGALETCVTFVVDGQTKLGTYFENAVATVIDTDYSAVTGSTNPTLPLSFGNDSTGAAATLAVQFKDVHLIVFDGGLPSNTQQIVNRLYSSPFYPITADHVTT